LIVDAETSIVVVALPVAPSFEVVVWRTGSRRSSEVFFFSVDNEVLVVDELGHPPLQAVNKELTG
jgi:hypothetical protein